MKKLFWLGLLAAGQGQAQDINLGALKPQNVSVYARDLVTGKTLTHRAEASMTPASTMKLVTSFAALRLLGPQFRWQTQWLADAPTDNGHLRGDLYWKGGGDPVFDQPDIMAMQKTLVESGIYAIDGKLAFDKRIWSDSGSARGFADDSDESFSTAPDAAMVAYKVLWLKPEADESGELHMRANPPLSSLVDKVRFGAGECVALKRYARVQAALGKITVSGVVPKSCVGQEMYVNVLSMQEFAAQSFAAQWQAVGGKGPAGHILADTPERARVLATHQSPPLSAVIKDMNKNSNNIIARSLFLTLGNQDHSAASTSTRADTIIRRELSAAGIDASNLVLENGSGFSRTERASAKLLGDILVQAWQTPAMKDIVLDSLPVGGEDGTLKTRFQESQGQWRLKTGTLSNARALAGYWTPHNGAHPLVVVIIVNGADAAHTDKMDALANALPALFATP